MFRRVPLAAQIEKVRRQVRYAQEDRAEMAEHLWSAVLESLGHAAMTIDILPIQIREDLTARIAGIPHDLTREEAEKIARVVLAMATPEGRLVLTPISVAARARCACGCEQFFIVTGDDVEPGDPLDEPVNNIECVACHQMYLARFPST